MLKTALLRGARLVAPLRIRKTPHRLPRTQSSPFIAITASEKRTMAATPTSHHNRPENRLAKEKSPYLLQHKNNPVDWCATTRLLVQLSSTNPTKIATMYPWGDEAIEKARRENKPIFLSVGYSTCHWCHVMERESFENEETAQIMNEHFVNIKVDREERPDVDKIYMTFVQATTGGGGWPMSVFLTPSLKPFFGGTYFPPKSKYGRTGFPDLLRRIDDLWRTRQESLIANGDEIVEALEQREADNDPSSESLGSLDIDGMLKNYYSMLTKNYDPKFGGFSRAPKFPRPVEMTGMYHYWYNTRDQYALGMVENTLQKMAAGGMNDQLGGGFHRYSVTHDWQVPHFEKMLYDQGQLVVALHDAYVITKNPVYIDIITDVLKYVQRDMTAPGGAFYSAEDADSLPSLDASHKSEGAFYIWSKDEINKILGDEDDTVIFNTHYGVKDEGNVEESRDPHNEFTGRNIIMPISTIKETAHAVNKTPEEVSESLARSKAKLFAAREKRPRPHLDDKILTAWNGLMISAFAKVYSISSDQSYLQSATNALRFIKEHMYDRKSGILLRNYREGPGDIHGFADDYAFLITALLDLYEATFDIEHLQWAVELQRKMDELFWDNEKGGYYGVGTDSKNLIMRMKEDYDGAEPSENSFAMYNLVRLSAMLHKDEYDQKADKLLSFFYRRLQSVPIVVPHLMAATIAHLKRPKQVVIAGSLSDPVTMELVKTTRLSYDPYRVVMHSDGGAGQKWLAEQGLDMFSGGESDLTIDGKPAVYLCQNFTCQRPITSVSEWADKLKSSR